MELFRARKEVAINNGGTSAYVVKHGPHKGRILGQITVKSNNNFQ